MKMKKRKQSIGNFYLRPKTFLNIYRFLCIVTNMSIHRILCLLYLRQFYKGINTVSSYPSLLLLNLINSMDIQQWQCWWLLVWNKEILFILSIYLTRKRLTRNTEISQKENMFLFISWFMPSPACNVFILMLSMICSSPSLPQLR